VPLHRAGQPYGRLQDLNASEGRNASVDFPGKDEARQRLALLAIQVGTANAAVRKELENYLRERPNDPMALARLAEVQAWEGAVDQAMKTYEKVVADYPLFAPATRQRANAWRRDSPVGLTMATACAGMNSM
jgi:predicted Zn-dependent protease